MSDIKLLAALIKLKANLEIIEETCSDGLKHCDKVHRLVAEAKMLIPPDSVQQDSEKFIHSRN